MRDFADDGAIAPGTGNDPFTVLDLSGRWNLTAHLALPARLDKLLDREYVVSRRPFGARPCKPLSAELGLGWSFRSRVRDRHSPFPPAT